MRWHVLIFAAIGIAVPLAVVSLPLMPDSENVCDPAFFLVFFLWPSLLPSLNLAPVEWFHESYHWVTLLSVGSNAAVYSLAGVLTFLARAQHRAVRLAIPPIVLVLALILGAPHVTSALGRCLTRMGPVFVKGQFSPVAAEGRPCSVMLSPRGLSSLRLMARRPGRCTQPAPSSREMLLGMERERRPIKRSGLPDVVLPIGRSRSVAQRFASIFVELGPSWLPLGIGLAALARITRPRARRTSSRRRASRAAARNKRRGRSCARGSRAPCPCRGAWSCARAAPSPRPSGARTAPRPR